MKIQGYSSLVEFARQAPLETQGQELRRAGLAAVDRAIDLYCDPARDPGEVSRSVRDLQDFSGAVRASVDRSREVAHQNAEQAQAHFQRDMTRYELGRKGIIDLEERKERYPDKRWYGPGWALGEVRKPEEVALWSCGRSEPVKHLHAVGLSSFLKEFGEATALYATSALVPGAPGVSLRNTARESYSQETRGAGSSSSTTQSFDAGASLLLLGGGVRESTSVSRGSSQVSDKLEYSKGSVDEEVLKKLFEARARLTQMEASQPTSFRIEARREVDIEVDHDIAGAFPGSRGQVWNHTEYPSRVLEEVPYEPPFLVFPESAVPA